MIFPEKIKKVIRPIKWFSFSVLYSIYDCYRYLRHSGILKRKDDSNLDYKLIKSYHSLEKSLIFKNRKKDAGWNAALKLLTLIENRKLNSMQERAAGKVLKEFYDSSATGADIEVPVKNFLDENRKEIEANNMAGGAVSLKSEFLLEGMLEKPEKFFYSRYSVRAFKKVNVDKSLMKRALELASKTPSVCNRQSWKVFHLSDRQIIHDALLLQNGNRGFSDEINDLLIIATDLRAFDVDFERFQQWIDGGLYAMSLVYALHSLGVASCFLNLSLPPSKDIQLRKLLKAPREYSFITMIAIGYPEDEVNVCASARTSYENYYFNLD